MPIVPALVVGILALVLLAINIGNQSAFLVLTSVAIIMFYLAYLGVTGPMLLRRLRGTWPTPEHGTVLLARALGHARQRRSPSSTARSWPSTSPGREPTSTTRSARTTGTSSGPPYLFIGGVMVIGAIYYFAVYSRKPIEVLAEHSAMIEDLPQPAIAEVAP